ncbi:MAG TPA: hypothetical protein VFN10_05415 [Thermoanaerobaculia bacterium]|nr:hypothetical protein [Thermoanaerobaculia bacterium]
MSAVLLLFALSATAFGADVSHEKVLFPATLHITRELTNPISGTKSTIDEYCLGNRVVSVSGSRTAIADYDKHSIMRIDFAAGTYSIASFEEVAKMHAAMRAPGTAMQSVAAAAKSDEWKAEARGNSVIASRPGETVELQRRGVQSSQSIRITADREMKLSRDAVEALTGLAYPNPRDEAADAILGALRANPASRIATNSAPSENEYRLPLEHVVRFEVDGESIESRNVVVRIGQELVPADAITLPPGVKLVDSDAVTAQRVLQELDGPSPAVKP